MSLALLEGKYGIIGLALPDPPPPTFCLWELDGELELAVAFRQSGDVPVAQKATIRTFRRVSEGEQDIYLYVEEDQE
jgi:hypothetical protein